MGKETRRELWITWRDLDPIEQRIGYQAPEALKAVECFRRYPHARWWRKRYGRSLLVNDVCRLVAYLGKLTPVERERVMTELGLRDGRD